MHGRRSSKRTISSARSVLHQEPCSGVPGIGRRVTLAINEILIPAVRDVVERLVRREFTLLEADGRCGRLTAEGLARAIDEYGRTLIEIPDRGWELADSYEIEGRQGAWGIDLPLWTQEEGRSDLTLSLSVSRTNEDEVAVEIDDLHVL